MSELGIFSWCDQKHRPHERLVSKKRNLKIMNDLHLSGLRRKKRMNKLGHMALRLDDYLQNYQRNPR